MDNGTYSCHSSVHILVIRHTDADKSLGIQQLNGGWNAINTTK
ncbi:hypothetical protein MHB77_31265 [Paenibacillus sp. FSL K6-3166]